MNNLCETCPTQPDECHAKISEVTFQSDIRPGKQPNDCSVVSLRGTAADAVVECTQYLRLVDKPTERGAA